MEELIKWAAENYGLLIAGVMFIEKIVKLTPTKYDDIVLDMIIKPLINGVKKK